MYIELNPVRAGVVPSPAEYRWSSYRFHAEGEKNRLLSPHTEYLALGTTAVERQLAYTKVIASRIADSTLDEIRDSTNKGWPLGSERFKDEIEAARARAARPPKRGRPKQSNTSHTTAPDSDG